MRLAIGLLPTGIGSLPYSNPEDAVKLVFSKFAEIPFWPQLPKKSPRENMYAQYAHNLPCARWDEQSKKLWFEVDDNTSAELAEFYEHILAENFDQFEFTSEEAAGFFAFLEMAPSLISDKTIAIKGQVTGPISFGLAVSDQNKKALIYNTELFEAIVDGLAIKARWQIRKLKELNKPVILFFDEPYLVSIGSAFANINAKKVKEYLRKVVEQAKSEDAFVGIHCCANTDWSLLLDLPIDILSLDAFEYFDNLMLYKEQLKDYLLKGGFVALGIVPTNERVFELNEEILADKATGKIFELAKVCDKDDISSQILITPACGLGSSTKAVAERALELTKRTSIRLKEGPLKS